MLYVKAPENEWRTSKSELALSTVKGMNEDDGIEFEESLEAVSMECDHVYEANACRPPCGAGIEPAVHGSQKYPYSEPQ